jgi:hypothetical protein
MIVAATAAIGRRIAPAAVENSVRKILRLKI